MHGEIAHRLFTFILVLVLGGVSTTALADFSGYWKGTWSSSNVPASGRVEATVTQNGHSISGSLSVFDDPNCSIPVINVPLTGTVIGNTASFNAQSTDPCTGEAIRLVFTNGTISGDTLTGSYENQYYDFGWVYWDHGIFNLNRVCCTINASSGSGGSILPSGAITLAPGENQGFSISPDPGYAVADVIVNNVSQGPVSTYTFTNVQSNGTITATFRQDCCTITAIAGEGGSIIPSGTVSVTYGTNQTFTIVPDSGYIIEDVIVDNVSQGALRSYLFTNTVTNHTITATFTKRVALPFLPIILED